MQPKFTNRSRRRKPLPSAAVELFRAVRVALRDRDDRLTLQSARHSEAERLPRPAAEREAAR